MIDRRIIRKIIPSKARCPADIPKLVLRYIHIIYYYVLNCTRDIEMPALRAATRTRFNCVFDYELSTFLGEKFDNN